MVDNSLKRFYHDLGFNIVRFSEKKIPLDENGNPKTGAVLEELHPIRPDVMAAKNWGVKHSNDPKCDNILFLDWDRGKILPEVRRLMITYRNKGGQESCHGIIRVADADKKWCEEFARTHGMDGLEIFAEKKNLALFGNYEIKDTDRRSQWHWIDSMAENGKIIDVTKEKLGGIFKRKARVTGSAAVVPAGVGERHNAILKEGYRLMRLQKDGCDFETLYGKIMKTKRIEGMGEYARGAAKHQELADIINFLLENQNDRGFAVGVARDLYHYAHIEGMKDIYNCWVYKDSVWREDSAYIILTELLKLRTELFQPGKALADNTSYVIAAGPRTLRVRLDIEYWRSRAGVIIDGHGNYFGFEGGKVGRVDPARHFFQRFDVMFELDGSLPDPEDFIDFLKARFGEKWELVRDELASIFLDASILGDRPKALYILGGRRTYKTFLNDLLYRLLNAESISQVTLRQVMNDNFAMGQIVGKRLLMIDDVTITNIKNEEIMKRLITQQLGQARDMNTMKSLKSYTSTKIIMNGNKPYQIGQNDDVDAIFDRYTYVETMDVAEGERKWYGCFDRKEDLAAVGMYLLRRAFEIAENPGCAVRQSLEETKQMYRKLMIGDIEGWIKENCEFVTGVDKDHTGVRFVYVLNRIREELGITITNRVLKERLEEGLGLETKDRVLSRGVADDRDETYVQIGSEGKQRTLILGIQMKMNEGQESRQEKIS